MSYRTSESSNQSPETTVVQPPRPTASQTRQAAAVEAAYVLEARTR